MDLRVSDDIQEVKKANRSILKKLNEITDNGTSKYCQCSKTIAQLTNDLARLNDSVEKVRLKESATELQDAAFDKRFAGIQSQLDKLHTSVQAFLGHGDTGSGTVANYNVSPLEAASTATTRRNANKNKPDSKTSINKAPTDTKVASDKETPPRAQVEKTDSTPSRQTTTKNATSNAVMHASSARDTDHVSSTFERNTRDSRNVSANNSKSEGTKAEPSSFKPSSKVFKPNFVTSPNRPQPPEQSDNTFSSVRRLSPSEAKVIRQTEKADLIGDEDTWKILAQQALKKGQQMCRHINCVVSVLCLDTSESMSSGNAWTQVKEFVYEYLTGLTEMKSSHPLLKDEYVAIATFGHKTELKLLMTNNYDEVQQEIDGIALGGPSPLYGGLYMALAGAMSSLNARPSINGITISPKIIVLTDGRPTDLMLNAGPDIADESKMNHTMAHLTAAVEEISNRDHSLFFVGVGDYDKNFIENMTAVLESKKTYTYREGRRLARRHYLAEDMKEIRDEAMRKVGGNHYRDSDDPTLPRLGTRVRRGSDWMWNNQDSGGPGTVVGHSLPAQVWVTWDINEQTNVYRYGLLGNDVVPVDEPRELIQGEKIAVGCVVKPGRDNSSTGLNSENVGVVLRIENAKALVKWDNGRKGNYSYGLDGKTEVEVCSRAAFRGQGFTIQGSSNGANEMNFGNSNINSNSNINIIRGRNNVPQCPQQ
ncbi:uncharacterized protein LOC127879103 isoform X2 [Dreissena polymorpha]|uniref:uncharacterized protein LOC127879103 isoform X2 n=1 Tax=Dreissena polymorpha TaxID=45954 RepID=UPI0022645820|nr:uncharacterized protein LOC127879103 isoform X2 [Dreissena polymorpha]